MVMKIHELSDEIASACGIRPKVVISVQKETFRLVRAALDKGERVQIPDFGIFSIKDVAGKEGEPGKRAVRFKLKDGKADKDGGPPEGANAKDPSRRGKKKAAKGSARTDGGSEEQGTAPVAEPADA
jgi:nucleoid DNA-binding protein